MELLEKETMDQDELASIAAEILQTSSEPAETTKNQGMAA